MKSLILTNTDGAKYRKYMTDHCSDSHSDYKPTEDINKDEYNIIEVQHGRFTDTIYIPKQQLPVPNDGYYVDWRSRGGCVWYYNIEQLEQLIGSVDL